MADLNTDVRYIRGVGETRARALQKLGIFTLRDLIGYFPRRYEDRTLTRPIRELAVGESVCVRAMLASDPTAHRISGGRTVVKARAVDESGALELTFFNQEYRKNSLHRGETYIFCGKVEGNLLVRRMTNPIVETGLAPQLHGGIEGLQGRPGPDARLQKLPQQPHGHGCFPVRLLSAAHAVAQQQIYAVAYLKAIHLVAAQTLPGPGPQGGADPVYYAALAAYRHGRLIQQLRKAGVLLPRAVSGLLQLPVELLAQQIVVGLAVNGLQQRGKMHAPGGKVQREIRRLRPAPTQQLRAGIVEGTVGVAVMALPAIGS